MIESYRHPKYHHSKSYNHLHFDKYWHNHLEASYGKTNILRQHQIRFREYCDPHKHFHQLILLTLTVLILNQPQTKENHYPKLPLHHPLKLLSILPQAVHHLCHFHSFLHPKNILPSHFLFRLGHHNLIHLHHNKVVDDSIHTQQNQNK